MGPKTKPQTPKDKRKKQDLEPDKEEKVTELEREFFVFQLAEIEKKLGRLAAREKLIKAETSEVEDKIEEFKKEKGTIVTVHEELLVAKEEEKLKKRDELNQLSKEMGIRIEKSKQSIKDLEVQYAKMVEELTEKTRQLEEEIRILEDYKQNKVAYNRKLEELEIEMNESEREHHRNLFRIEKKWENARGRLKKELQSRLLQLSIEFRQTSQKKIGKPCHRVTQENKAIHTALMEMKEEIQQYSEKEAEMKTKIVELREHKNKKKDEKDKMIARTVIQVHIIKTLLKNQAELFGKLKTFAALDATNRMLLKKLHVVDSENERKTGAIERLKMDTESKVESMNKMKDAKRYMRKSTRRMQASIRNCLKMLEEASSLKLIPIGEAPEDKVFSLEGKIRLYQKRRLSIFNKRGRFLQYLFEMLTKYQLSEEDRRMCRSSSESAGLEQVHMSIIYGKSIHSIDKEADERESAVAPYFDEKAPFVLTSDTSLPRSESSLVIRPIKIESEEESFEGEVPGYDEEAQEEGPKEEEVEEAGEKLPEEFVEEVPGEEWDEIPGEEEVPPEPERLNTESYFSVPSQTFLE